VKSVDYSIIFRMTEMNAVISSLQLFFCTLTTAFIISKSANTINRCCVDSVIDYNGSL